jgi:3-oxoadipate enol-lactonase
VSTRTAVRRHVGPLLRKLVTAPSVPTVPEGQMVELPGRGKTFVVDVPGPEGAPTVMLLHALGCTAYLSWYPVLAELAKHYRVITFDQRWHGRGIRSPRFSFEDCADDAVALMDVLGIDAVIPVGYSMGGAIAQLMWKQHPTRVEGLVLAATARNFQGARRERFFFPVMTVAMKPLLPVVRTRGERVHATLPELPGFDSSGSGWGLIEFRSTSAWNLPAVLEQLGRFNSRDWISGVDVPTAVIVTLKDHTIPQRRQRKLAASIPNATVVELDGGHASLVLKANVFGPALLEALSAVTTPKRAKKIG